MQRNSVLRFVTLFLIFTTAVIYITSCANENETDEKNNDITTISGNSDTETAAEGREGVSDGLPEFDFADASFTILAETNANVKIFENYWYVESDSGDVIDSAVYNRDRTINERFNTQIKYDFREAVSAHLTKTVAAGDDIYDLAAFHVISAGQSTLSDIYMKWNNIPNVDFSRDWWSDSTTEDLTCNGITLIAVGDVALSSISQTYCMFFNKKLAEDYGITGVYDIVINGGWTIDRLMELSAGIYSDLNMNSEKDTEDLYGFVTNPYSNNLTYFWAFGNKIYTKNIGGKMELTYMSDKLVSVMDKLYNLIFETEGSMTTLKYDSPYGDSAHGLARDLFANSQAVFANGFFNMAVNNFRDMKDEYGIIPYPKWNEDQKDYLTMCDGNFEALMVPKTIQNKEKTGIITEALNAESWRSVVPAFYEIALKYKYTRDEESIGMLDLIVAGRVFDFGFVYDGTKGCSFIIQTLITQKSKDIASYYAKNEKSILKQYDAIFEYFNNYDA